MENSIIIASLKRHGNKPVHRKTLANMLSVKKNQRSKFYRQIDRLISQGILTSSGSGRIRLAAANAEGGKPAKKKPASRPKKPAGLVGKMLISRRGYGFVAVEGRDDIFVPARDMAGAAAGDQVLVKLVRSGRKGPAGKILEILKRQRDTVVGTVERTPAGYELSLPWRFANRVVRIDGRTADQELEGALVYARITDWGDGTRPIGAEVLEVIGSPSDPQTDFRNVLLQFELTEQFPDKVEAEVQGLVDRGQHKIWEGRTDLRELGAITIDPASAKDFDDAISLQQLDDGRTCLGVHIADVSHYV
ncbi:MAG: RNB domain-containing ribonuclease, partial [Candidatus Marinimicrobia bacterium]|nr:RNB domain-containing ribonuclease [Candidatus Neomarinimicrobiota bacterium]